MPLATYIAHIRPRSTRFWRFLRGGFGVFCPPWTAAPKRLSQWSGRDGTGTSWLQLVATYIAHIRPRSTRFWRFLRGGFGVFCPPCTAAPKRLSQWSGRDGTGTSWLQLVAVVCGAVWYATGYLHSPYTAAEHSILAFFGGFCPPWTAASKRLKRLSQSSGRHGTGTS